MKWLQHGAILAMTGLVVGFGLLCLAADRLIGIVARRPKVQAMRHRAYGPGPRGMLDVYRPEDGRDLPVVVFFYGGSWQMGNRRLYRFVGEALAQRGILALIADYRLYPQIRFPEFLRDGARATRWARDHAADYAGNPSRIFLMGHSAGAHIAAMLAMDEQWLAEVGMDPERDIAGWIGLAGTYDFNPLRQAILIDLFGGANRPETQPISFVNAGNPPAFLATGRADKVVGPGNVTRLAEPMRAHGVHVETAEYPGGHFRIIFAVLRLLNFLEPVANDVADFIHRSAARR